MKIYIGSVTKEINSTFRPTLTKSIDVQLKDDVSLTSPVILIRGDIYDSSWNYCYIPAWRRYYFLHDAVIQTGNIWAVQLAIDVLASWKTYIQNASAYVRRSASNYSNFIEDSTWSHSTDYQQVTAEIDCGFNTTGFFVMITASDDSIGSIPSMSVYAMAGSTFKNICNYMFSQDFWDSIKAGYEETYQSIVQTFFNPSQYIIKCMWFPFSLSDVSAVARNISFGWWDSSIAASGVTSEYVEKTFSFTLGAYTDWTCRNAGWTKNYFYMPCFGQMEISPDYQGKTLTGKMIIDITTGEAGLFIRDEAGNLVQSATGKVGCEIQVTSLYEDFTSDFGTKGNAISSAITAGMGAVVGAAKSFNGKTFLSNLKAANTIGLTGATDVNLAEFQQTSVAEDAVKGAQSAFQPSMSTIGAMGTRAIIERQPNAILTIQHYVPYADIHTRLGGVCNQVLNLSELSGYTEVVNPHVDCPATSNEISMINSFLSGGFYLE